MTFENPTYHEAKRWVDEEFRWRYKKSVNDMDICKSRGYWEDKHLCRGECGMGHTEPIYHTYSFAQHGRGESGRFLKPYRAWEVIKERTEKERGKFNRFAVIDLV
jgi:hypothetical protein